MVSFFQKMMKGVCDLDVRKLGAFIQTRRKELGMTQGEVAARLNVTDKAISRWERGVGFPDIQLLEPLAEALQISIQELMQCERAEQIAMVMPENAAETTPEIKKESLPGRYSRILAVLCYLAYELFYLLSGNPQYAQQQVWMSPLNRLLFLAAVGAFLCVSYREVHDEVG